MKLKKRLEMIQDENNCILDNQLRIHYILNHIVYDELKPREIFVLGEFLLELLENIKTNSEGIENILRGLLKN